MAGLEQAKTEKEKIRFLRQKYDFNKKEDVLALYAILQGGQISFHTPEGRAFDDEVYELATKFKKEQQSVKSSEKKAAGKSAVKKVVVVTKREYRIRKVLRVSLVLVAIGCFSYFGFYSYSAYQKDVESKRLAGLKENEQISSMYKDEVIEEIDEETGEKKYFKVLEEYKSLYNKNKNLIGWLKIDDTVIDYPVMQSENEDFYLDHDINQEYDSNGTLFMDSECNVRKPSTNYIVYGHNMRSGKMFGGLSQYKSQKYYEAHKEIQFDTIYEKSTYEVMYAFNSHIYKEDEITFKYYQFIEANSEQEFNSYMKEMAEMSLYETGVTAQFGDQLLTLSTCDYDETDGRFVVVAKKIQ